MSSNGTAEVSHEYANVNGLRVHYARAGEGPLIVFLHGFPQCWYEFRHQLAEFSRDHLAVAPDLRGYNLSSKPHELQSYGVLPAVEDLRQLVGTLGYERFVLVGHDWGAAVAWSFALHYPEQLERLVILSTAHPALFDRELHENPEQQRASQYLLAVRQPNADEILCADDYALMRAQFDFPWMNEEDLQVYHRSWKESGSLKGQLNWYRREGLGPPSEEGTPARGNYVPEVHSLVVHVPTLVIYGDADVYTRPGCHRGLDEYVPDVTLKTIEGGSHWIADEFPDLVNHSIREFLGASVAGALTE
jgi:epoxide hydrolase 4